jgi:hypothetical protein
MLLQYRLSWDAGEQGQQRLRINL